MKLYIIELIFDSGNKKRLACFALSENDAKGIVISRWEIKNRQLINKPEIKLVKLVKCYPIRRGILRSE